VYVCISRKVIALFKFRGYTSSSKFRAGLTLAKYLENPGQAKQDLTSAEVVHRKTNIPNPHAADTAVVGTAPK
jgi:hypothetical protein